VYRLFSNVLIACLLASSMGCVLPSGFPTERKARCEKIYVFGDSSYDEQLSKGVSPIKLGPISASEVPASFPAQFLEPDGSYAGGHIYCSIEEAESGILEAKRKGIISAEGDWGIYQLQGHWDEYAYELHPNEFYLRKSTPVLRRVK